MRNKIQWLITFIILALVVFIGGCSDKNENKILFEIKDKKITDSKFYNQDIVSGIDGHLVFLNESGNIIKEYPDVKVNWIYAYPEEKLLAIANNNQEVRIIKLNENYDILSDDLIVSTENLMIDPTIIKTQNGKWILTITEIIGSVNEADINKQNGNYTIKCFTSDNLNDWQYITNIISDNRNLEDGDIYEFNSTIYFLFERESRDKNPSGIFLKSSLDGGYTWSNEKELVPSVADNEMSTLIKNNNGYTLYYSSDYGNVGKSYNIAKIYTASFDQDFNAINLYNLLDIDEKNGIRLYDVAQIDKESKLYLYSKNYLTENRLVLKQY